MVDDGAELRVSAENASFSVKTMDGTPITQSYGGFTIPNFEGSLMLEIEGNVTNNGVTDTTTRYVLIYKDNIAPIVTLYEPAFFAAAETGDFTVSGITEPGATVDYGAIDEEGRPITVQADADGRFSISGSLGQGGDGVEQYSSPSSPMPERTCLRLL